MKRIDVLLADYGQSHRAPGNVACHTVGIALILFGILSVLHAVPISGFWTASEALVAATSLWYFALDTRLGIAMLGTAALFDLVARLVDDWRVGAAAFVAGWVFQGIGHAVYERNSPAFVRNLVHLLVGPVFLVNKVLKVRRTGPA